MNTDENVLNVGKGLTLIALSVSGVLILGLGVLCALAWRVRV